MALRRPAGASAPQAPVSQAQQDAPATSTAAVATAPKPQAAPQAAPAPQPQPQPQAAPQASPSTAVATRPTGALSTGNSGLSLTDFHGESGAVLEGFFDAPAGNFVTIDGSEFYIKSLESRERELNIIVSYAKNYYHFKDENGQHHESDTKIDDRYSFKTRVEWLDFIEGEEDPQKFILTLPTTSAIQFNQYVRALATQGIGLGKIWTNMKLERLEKKVGNETVRYSRVVFANAGEVQYES